MGTNIVRNALYVARNYIVDGFDYDEEIPNDTVKVLESIDKAILEVNKP